MNRKDTIMQREYSSVINFSLPQINDHLMAGVEEVLGYIGKFQIRVSVCDNS